jgi:threonine synthase
MPHLVCSVCGAESPFDAPIWRCACGGLLDIVHTPEIDPAEVAKRPPTLWRYREAIALARNATVVTLGEGCTPLLPIELEHVRFLAKLEQIAPTGSFKDRGACVLMTQAAALGIDTVVEDSSGNAGSAIAAYGARAGVSCHIHVPASTSPAKLGQIAAYGATLHRIPGTREDTANAALKAAEATYYASHVWNPFFLQGTKTWAYEVCEQLGWRAPDAVVLPIGNGTLLLGAALGFAELEEMGLIGNRPRLIGVQAAACAPLVEAYRQGMSEPAPVTPAPTRAEGIAIAAPRRGQQILEAVHRSRGTLIAVSEDEIAATQHALGRQGLYIEATAAVAPAGLLALRRRSVLRRDATLVTALTGHGLKTATA